MSNLTIPFQIASWHIPCSLMMVDTSTLLRPSSTVLVPQPTCLAATRKPPNAAHQPMLVLSVHVSNLHVAVGLMFMDQ